MTEKEKTLTIYKDDLSGVARKAENLTILLSDIEDDYFGKIDYKETLIYNAERLRKYIGTCVDIVFELTKELHKNGIWCYDK